MRKMCTGSFGFNKIILVLTVAFAAPLCGLAYSAQPEDANKDDVVFLGGPHRPGFARPPLFAINPLSTTSTAAPYTPAQVRHAYGFDQLTATGKGQTIAIVDAYGSPSIQKDLNAFCAYFNLATTTVQVLYPQGTLQANTSWAQETTLDVEWAHVIAPDAKILLVVAKSSSWTDLLSAVDSAVSAGATTVSMSWGAAEFSGETRYDSHFKHSGVTFVASSGDSGESSGVEWPAASPYVIGVGGTSLYLDASGNYASESAWSGGGGGISIYETKPTFQNGWQTTTGRGVPDVSYLADPNTGVYVYYAGSWYVFGGTSVGAPQWAAAIAVSNSMRSSGTLSTAPGAIYSVAGSADVINTNYFHDVTTGNNGPDTDDFAIPGYDFVTGLGSPITNSLLKALSAK